MTSAREHLAAQQAALVRALTGVGDIPAGFAAERVQRAARSLVNKRITEVARVWPHLAAALGTAYAPRFRAYAETTPPPERGGPLADGRAFAATLAVGEWTDAATWERIGVDLHHVWSLRGLRRRRGYRWICERLPQSRRWVVRLRWPGGFVQRIWG